MKATEESVGLQNWVILSLITNYVVLYMLTVCNILYCTYNTLKRPLKPASLQPIVQKF